MDIIELLKKQSETNKTIINFLVIGASKSGSSWLTDMLSQHPSIYISKIKEIHYFNAWYPRIPGLANSNRKKSSEWYSSFFRSADAKQLKGEGTTTYLWDPDAAQNIFEFDPDIKLIAILRDPVHRIFSSYLSGLNNGLFTKMGFSEFVKQRPKMLTVGLYFQNLQRYYNLFPANNIYVVLFDDLINNKRQLLKDIEAFLGVAPFIPNNIDQIINYSGEPRLKYVNYVISQIKIAINKAGLNFMFDWMHRAGLGGITAKIIRKNIKPFSNKPDMSTEMHDYLADFYRNEIENLERLIVRDLSAWKS